MKKTLSLLLAVLMALSAFSAGVSAFAAESKSVTVEFGACDGGFVFEPQDIKVSADLSDKYEQYTGCNDNSEDGRTEEPTILDAIIAAHIAKYGEKFYDTAAFEAYPSGWIKTFFGKSGAFSYRLNSGFASGITETLSDGDYIEFEVYQDAEKWSDKYAYFETRELTVSPNKSVQLRLFAEDYDENYNPVETPVGAATVTVNGEKAAQTTRNGTANLTFDKSGTYYVSAECNTALGYIFAPWCKVNVTYLPAYIEKEMLGGAEYLASLYSKFEAKDAINYLILLKSGYDMSSFEEGFLNNVKAALDGGEANDIGILGATVQILEITGKNPYSFEGYNLVEMLEGLDLKEATYHPYFYRVAVEAAGEEYAKALCDDLIKDYYTLGSGMNYWGYSCDNTGYFLTTISRFSDDYSEYVKDAKAVLETFKKENGAICDPQWVPDVNANSTALSMMAYASVGDLDTAFWYYKKLVDGFEGSTGVFKSVNYQTGKLEENSIATRDCLMALEYFYEAVVENDYEHPEHLEREKRTEPTYTSKGSVEKYCLICGETLSKTEIPKLAKNGWFKENGKWFYYKNSVAQKYWQKIGNKWYYMNSKGEMVTGWLYCKGKWYYLTSSGAMATGWQKIGGKWYYLASSGAMATGWLKDGGKWYYLTSSGAMATGWQKIGGKWYYLASSGAMATGWQKIGGKWYYLESSGAMRTANLTYKGKVYRFNSSGACVNP